MSDLGPSKGAHHITENLIKHMSDEQGPSNTRPKNRCRGPFHLIILQRSFLRKKSLFLLRKIYSKSVFSSLSLLLHTNKRTRGKK